MVGKGGDRLITTCVTIINCNGLSWMIWVRSVNSSQSNVVWFTLVDVGNYDHEEPPIPMWDLTNSTGDISTSVGQLMLVGRCC